MLIISLLFSRLKLKHNPAYQSSGQQEILKLALNEVKIPFLALRSKKHSVFHIINESRNIIDMEVSTVPIMFYEIRIWKNNLEL